MYWLEFSVALDESLRPFVKDAYKEADELLAIIVASLKTARANQEKIKASKATKE